MASAMATGFQITIEQYPRRPYCHYHPFPSSRDNFYVFATGRRISLVYTPVWCRTCREITPGERLRTISEIDKLIREYEQWDPSTQRDRHLDDFAFQRQWMIARQSPPRCLRCFSPDVYVLPVGQKVPHPGGDQSWITVSIFGFVDPVNSGDWLLDPEGLPLKTPSHL